MRRWRAQDTIVVGSKNFPEQALLGEILAQHLEARTHLRVERRFYLAGSLHLPAGDAGAGASTRTWNTPDGSDGDSARSAGARSCGGVGAVQREYQQRFRFDVLPSLGFNDTFAIVMRGRMRGDCI